jgi:hypothetical protein
LRFHGRARFTGVAGLPGAEFPGAPDDVSG